MNASDVWPRITFGIIVLNGEPFTRPNLQALYPFAHQIIVVEGACPSAHAVASAEGHSCDGTLESLRAFQREADPDDKVILITAEDVGHSNGFWSEKDEMSQAYAACATGDYLWQIDIDEFYRPEDMQRIWGWLRDDPQIKAITFQVKTFWGSLRSYTDGIFLRQGAQDFHRLFAWGPGYRYMTHRPPTVTDAEGNDLRAFKSFSGSNMAKRGVFLYHYSYVFPFQVRFKLEYYGNMDRAQKFPLQKQRQRWHDNFFSLKDPFYIDDTSILGEPSWLVPFHEAHPPVIRELWRDIEEGRISIELRQSEDIDTLLARSEYRLVTRLLPILWKPREWLWTAARRFKTVIHAVWRARA